jgi:hypothetical protein
MRIKEIVFSVFFLLFLAATVRAEVGVDLDIHVGGHNAPPPPVVVSPPPIAVEAPPEMIYADGLGVYVAVGIPYDLFFYGTHYYYYAGGVWYRSAYYGGPWVRVVVRKVPHGLRRYRIEEIREYRRRAWEDYRAHEGRYRGRHFLARESRERREQRRDEGHFKGRGEERRGEQGRHR